MGGRRIIDLSFEVYQGMVVYPSVAKPVIVELENHAQMARSMGTDAFGVDHLPNHCMIVTGDHVGTHLDSWGHVNPDAPRVEGIPLEYCYGDGVVLDLTSRGPGEEIWPDDLEGALQRIAYTLKPLDIVLLRTDAATYRDEKRYLTDHPGMTKEAVHWLLDRGIKMMGIDAVGFDPARRRHVRAAEVLGGPSGDAGAGVLPPGEPLQPGPDPAPLPLLHRQRAAGELAGGQRRPGAGGGDPRSRSLSRGRGEGQAEARA